MKAVERTICASRDGKILFLTVNKKRLSIPWRETYFYQKDKVLVSIEKVKDEEIYCIRPADRRLQKNETHWKVVQNGIPSENNG